MVKRKAEKEDFEDDWKNYFQYKYTWKEEAEKSLEGAPDSKFHHTKSAITKAKNEMSSGYINENSRKVLKEINELDKIYNPTIQDVSSTSGGKIGTESMSKAVQDQIAEQKCQ